jgi:hypothetical protein
MVFTDFSGMVQAKVLDVCKERKLNLARNIATAVCHHQTHTQQLLCCSTLYTESR